MLLGQAFVQIDHVQTVAPCLLVPRPSEVEDVAYSEEDAAILETAQVQIGLRYRSALWGRGGSGPLCSAGWPGLFPRFISFSFDRYDAKRSSFMVIIAQLRNLHAFLIPHTSKV